MFNIFKSHSDCPERKTLFYIFEVCALVIAVLYVIVALYAWLENWGFVSGLLYIASGIVNSLVLFGFGKLLDGRPSKHCGHCPPDAPEKHEEQVIEEQDAE